MMMMMMMMMMMTTTMMMMMMMMMMMTMMMMMMVVMIMTTRYIFCDYDRLYQHTSQVLPSLSMSDGLCTPWKTFAAAPVPIGTTPAPPLSSMFVLPHILLLLLLLLHVVIVYIQVLRQCCRPLHRAGLRLCHHRPQSNPRRVLQLGSENVLR
jgi:hypothetical protein